MSTLQHLFDEMHNEPFCKKLTNSELITAMHSDVLEVRNIARIIADRRGIQVIEVNK